MTAKHDLSLSRGFDAGNYASAYETTNYAEALASLSPNRSAGYVAAFTLGFFSSYELHEMGEHTEAYLAAFNSEHGQRCVALGYVEAHHGVDYEAAAAAHESGDTGGVHTSMTFGVLPTREAFDAAFNAYCPDGTFSFGNDPYVGTEKLDASQVWDQLGAQLDTFNEGEHTAQCGGDGSCDGSCPSDEAGSWCSAVLGQLGFEWI